MQQLALRGFWRRWIILFCLFSVGIVVIIVLTKRQVNSVPQLKLPKFTWLDLNNVTDLRECRNSKQGPYLIADEKGQLCGMREVQPNGCCNSNSNSTKRFVCTTCQANRCCRVFEHCITCCLQPHKRKVLEKVLLHSQNSKNPLLKSVHDTFELCLHKCRTSSTSVHRENRYRDSLYKYCYGVDPPTHVIDASQRTNALK